MSNVNELNHPPPYISMIINQKTDMCLHCSPPSTLFLFQFRNIMIQILFSFFPKLISN